MIQLSERCGVASHNRADSSAGSSASSSSRDQADHAIIGVRDVNISRGIHGDRDWIVQLRLSGVAGVAGITCRIVSGDGADGSRASDLANYIVTGVGDIKIAR